ncbi:meiosis 1 arrest protein-like [Schistocerca cancellata]|uniref:meiosis 1 arrest protein-like n=1 Tax=Schistocerca cancellata TaxID=274614 RepID=UPI0021177691|nr:meiosis 1 arrest protein-like [Schistocerca cancellata]
MSRFSQNTRTAYCRQPVQHVLLDIGYPMTPLHIKTTITALQNVLTLACSLRGGIRIPGFGVSVINKTFELIYWTDVLRGNFSKVLPALNSVESYAAVNEKLSEQEFQDCLNLGILSVIEEFKTRHNGMPGGSTGNFMPLLQITLITRKTGLPILEFLEKLLHNIEKTQLKRIQVAELTSYGENSFQLLQMPSRRVQNSLAFIELVYLTDSEDKMQDFFKIWLCDCDSDQEHLRLLFPGKSKTKIDFTVKCDIRESIINTLSLPYGHRYQIQTDFFSFQFGGNSVGKNSSKDLPIFELEVIARVSLSGLCESFVFGFPHRLYPTQCWRLDWEEILYNQQCFATICQYLTENEIYLLTRIKAQHRSDQVFGFYILVAGDKSLLLKSVASAEITLPSQDAAHSGQISEELLIKMSNNLTDLPLIQDFNPQLFISGLYTALNHNLIHVSSLGAESGLRSFHPAFDNSEQEDGKHKRTKKISQQHSSLQIDLNPSSK